MKMDASTNAQPVHQNNETPSQATPDTTGANAELPMALLQAGCKTWDIELSDTQIEQFETYYHELVQWNQKFNLTAITEYEDVQTKHFLDSISGLPILAEELGESLPLSKPYSLLDVGSGAGLPGIPLKLIAPSIQLTLLDGTQKKVRFLEQVCGKLSLNAAEVVRGRAEELARQGAFREQFDVVTARAVAALNTLVEYLLPLVRVGGYTLIYKGGHAASEFTDARRAISVLGGETVRFAPVDVPYLDQQRFVLLIKKIAPTPQNYPRGQGLARKQPIS